MSALTEPRYRLPILLLVAVAARAAVFGDPVVHVDESFYYAIAKRMWDGALPFVDIWDRKPIGLFLVYMPAAALPGYAGIWAYQLIALGCVVATAMLVARLATLAGWARGATAAGIAYILWLDPLGGVGGQAPVFYNLPMTLAAWLVVTAPDGRRRRRGAAAMALVGVSLQIKYSAVFEGFFFGLWLLAQEWRSRGRMLPGLGYGVALVALALLPTAVVFAYYAQIGLGEAFVFANFTSILARRADPWGEALGNGASLLLMLSPLVALAFGSRGTATGGDAATRRFLFGWFAVALAAIVLFRGWFEHYGLPAVAPGAACAAGFLGARRWRGRATPAILLAVALIGQVTVIVNRMTRGSAAEMDALTAAVGDGPGCLYVYSSTAMLYATSHRCTVTRYLFPSHLGRERENGAIGVDQVAETRRIFATRPAVVVTRPPYDGERADIRAIAEAELARAYRRTAVLRMGGKRIDVYMRR